MSFERNTAIIYTVDHDFRKHLCTIKASGHATEVMTAVHELCTHIFRGHTRWWFQKVYGELSKTDAEMVSDMDWTFHVEFGE